MKMNKKNSKVVLFVLAFICLILCITVAITTRLVYRADDLAFHFSRFGGVREGLQGGQFPIKYYNGWCYGGGYLGSIFYGDLFLIPFVLISFIGIPLEACYFLFICVVYFALWFVMFLLAKKYLKLDVLAIISATIFTISNYMYVEVFYRAALGEAVAIIFFLVLLLGIYNLLHEDYSKPWLFLIAFAGILFSHMTTLFFAMVTLLLAVLFNCKKLFKDKKFWIKSVVVFGLFLLVGLYFILSFIEMYLADTYAIAKPWTTTSKNAQGLWQILGFTSPYGVGFTLPLVALSLRLVLFKLKNTKEDFRLLDKFLLISCILILITSKIFPWKLFDSLLGVIQFPWRLNFIISILLSLVIGLEINLLCRIHIKWSVIVTIILFVSMFITNCCINFMNTNPERDLSDYSPGKYEWYPINTVINDFNNRNVYDSNGNPIVYVRDEHTTDVNFTANEDSEYYIVPIVYYKGYQATLVSEDGVKTNLAIESCENSMIKIKTNHENGKVYLHYAGTTIQNVSLWISLVSVFAIVVGSVTYTILQKKQNKTASI